MRLVLDTDVIVAAIRSPGGASSEVLSLLLKRQHTMLLSVPLAFEYEAVCTRPEHILASGGSVAEIDNMLDAINDVIVPVEIHYQWRPQLTDAGDEMVLEAAVNGRADAIATFNIKDYSDAPARFGVSVLKPGELLKRIRL